MDSSGRKKYVVYDDSGYHFRNSFGISDKPPFCDILSPDQFRQVLTSNEILAISCEFNRAYLRGNDVATILMTYFRELLNDNTESVRDMSDQMFEGCRLMCVESATFKKFFAQNKMSEREILDKNLSHYVWLFEAPRADSGYVIYLVDASAHRRDFYTSIIDKVFVRRRLSTLSKVD